MPSKIAVDDFYVALGSNVRRARDRAGLSQADVAGRLGLARASVANLEAGRQRPPVHYAVMIADLLGVAIKELLPGAPTEDTTITKSDELLEWARGRLVSQS